MPPARISDRRPHQDRQRSSKQRHRSADAVGLPKARPQSRGLRTALTLERSLCGLFGPVLAGWRTHLTQASLGPIAVPSVVGLYMMATILGTCLLSFAITHLLYLRAVREEIRSFRQFLVTAGLGRWR